MTEWVWRRLYGGVIKHAFDARDLGRRVPPGRIIQQLTREQAEAERDAYDAWARRRSACGAFTVDRANDPELAGRRHCRPCERVVARDQRAASAAEGVSS